MPYISPVANKLSTVNSTTAVLGASAVFTGTAEDVLAYKQISIAVSASHISATDGLSIEQSSDGTTWLWKDTYNIAANEGKLISIPLNARYFRIVYTNGATLQTSFTIHTILLSQNTKDSSVRPQDGRSNDNDMTEGLSYGMIWNGTTWDRVRSSVLVTGNITTQNLVPAGVATAGSALEIDLKGAGSLMIQTTGTYTGALSLQVTVNGTTWVTLSGNPILNVNGGAYLGSITSALQSIFQADVIGATKARITGLAAMTGTAIVSIAGVYGAPSMVALDNALPGGGNTIGTVGQNGTWTMQPGNTPNTVAWLMSLRPATSGGLLVYKLLSLATTNPAFIKASAGQIYAYEFFNGSAAVKFVKFYNKASAPTVGTDVPVRTVGVPAGGRVLWDSPLGSAFSTGIAIAVTGAYTDADTTAVAAGDIIGAVDYF